MMMSAKLLLLLVNLSAGLDLLPGGSGLLAPPQFRNSAMGRYLDLATPSSDSSTAPQALLPMRQGPPVHLIRPSSLPPVPLPPPPPPPLYIPHLYQRFIGNGTVAQGWPDQSEWIDLATMWQSNQQNLTRKICDNSDQENNQLLQAIIEVSRSTGVDPRFILAIVMEESRGCVRVGATSLAVVNPGLMQSYQGKGQCASPLQNPCPYSEILLMIQDGTAPNAAGEDLQDLLQLAQTTDVSRYYKAARMYNSGQHSIGPLGELSQGGANACYASDIANRLLGYVGDSCGPDGATWGGWP